VRRRKLITLGGAALISSLAVTLAPGIASAVDQTEKNGCSSPEVYSGALTSPSFTTPVSGTSQVRFQGWFEAESVAPSSHDLAVVEYSLDGGLTWDEAGRLMDTAPANSDGAPDKGYSNNGTGQAPSFQSYSFDLPVESTMQLRFRFDAADSIYNGFRGFAVDDVSIDTFGGGQLIEDFESPPNGWTYDPPSAPGPNVPFWHAVSDPQGIRVKSPEINPALVTLPDAGFLPAAPGGTRVAWFGDDATGTFCGPDYANRFQAPPFEPPPTPPPPARRTLADLPNPLFASTVNVDTLAGTVTVAGKGVTTADGRARTSQKGLTFVPLTEARQIPVGSFLDTRRGTVRLQSARDRRGTRQNGDFSRGLFQVLQSRRGRGLTDVVLKGASFASCRRARRGKGAARTAQSRLIRRLRSNARGRFRTRGRHTAATVRGTAWLTADRCDGTLTKVTRGRVAVRDFRRRKTVVVRAGKSYLARAKR
jgi:hypothetical protein